MLVLLHFQLQSGGATLGKNMPSVAGNLKWSQQLRSRILSNRSDLCQLPHVYVQKVVISCRHC